MSTDPSLIDALEAVLSTDPDNTAIRLHLADLLLEAGEPSRALSHLEQVLMATPDDPRALDLAANAADALGDSSRASAWRRVAEALSGGRNSDAGDAGTPPLQPPAGPGPAEPVEVSPSDAPVDWDAELQALMGAEHAKRITLADVAGLDEVKQRLETSFLGPMRNSELREHYGASLRGGLLLWGPPGCGKTFLARAVAGELGAHFLSVGLHEVLDMWFGNSEKRLHDLFQVARRNNPAVLFFDEVDAIGHARADLNRTSGRNVVVQLLTELDGVDENNDGVFVIGATNQPWDVDPALRRPGRLDRGMLVLPPDPPAREAILRFHLRGRPTDVDNLRPVVQATDGFSGADLRLVCEEAAQETLAEAVRTGNPRPIGGPELLRAAQGLRPSTTPWIEMAQNFATYSNSSGEYDELVTYLQARRRSGK